jgi:hypothetical protein
VRRKVVDRLDVKDCSQKDFFVAPEKILPIGKIGTSCASEEARRRNERHAFQETVNAALQ